MIPRFGARCALLVIDAQEGVNSYAHWGGSEGRRINPNNNIINFCINNRLFEHFGRTGC